jgi:DNA replication protein DnaC
MLGEQNKKDVPFIFEDEWKLHKYNDSNDFEKIKEILIENKGILIQGRAGTGKSYVAQEIAKIIGNVAKVAFTNKASLNIKGSTIHKFLKLDKGGNINKQVLNKIKKYIKYIIVDEISLISKYLWMRLVEVKKSKIILIIQQ